MKYIIDFIDTISEQLIQNYITENSMIVLQTFSSFKKCFLVESNIRPPLNNIIESITLDDDITLTPLIFPSNIGKDYPMCDIQLNNDIDWWKVVSIPGIDFNQQTTSCRRRGSNSVVYVVDSGVKADHIEFEFSDIENLYSFNDNFNDYSGHGTAIASVISGKKCGLTSAKIKSVKIFQPNVPTRQSHLLSALDVIIQDISNSPNILPVVNLSWAISRNSYVESKIQTLCDIGIPVVVSAGNNGVPIENVTPAAMKQVRTIGSFNRDLTPCNFSNYTSNIANTSNSVNYGELNAWAPGEHIQVADINGDYAFASGTSISAAIHSAAIAYNSFLITLSDGALTNSKDQSWNYHTTNILTLTDVYSNSVNRISTFIAYKEGEFNASYPKIFNMLVMVTCNELINWRLITLAVSDNIIFADPLPEGLILDSGFLRGSIASEKPFLWKSTWTYVDYNGITYNNLPITILALPKNFDKTSLEQNDPVLDIVLNLQNQCGGVSGPPGNRYCTSYAYDCDLAGGSCVDENWFLPKPHYLNCQCSA